MTSFQEGGGAAMPFAVVTHAQPWHGQGAPVGADGRRRRASSSTMAAATTPVSPFSDGSFSGDGGGGAQMLWPVSPGSSNDSHGHGSSPEGESACASARATKSGRTPSRYDWSKYMPVIKKLYIDEDMTLNEVLDVMLRDHNFVATPRMVKTRLKKWGYSKNVSVKSDEVEALMELIFDAESQGDVRRTSTEVTLATGRVVGLDRVAAHLRRKRIPASIVQKASQLSLARYYHHGSGGAGSPSPTSLAMASPVEFRLPESIFADVHSYVYGNFERQQDATAIVWSGPGRRYGDIVDLASSARQFFVQRKDDEALVLLRKLPARLQELLDSGHQDIPRILFFALILLLNIPEMQQNEETVKALVRYVAELASGQTSNWPEQHPLRRILVALGQAADESLLEVVTRGYKCLLLSYESLPAGAVDRHITTPAWLDLGESAGFESLPVAHLERSLQKAYEASLGSRQEMGQTQPFQHLFWMSELERQKSKALGLPTDRLKELYFMTLTACEGMGTAAMNAQMNCHYYLAKLYHTEGNQTPARSHLLSAIDASKEMGIPAGTAWLMAELQGWHREWGETDEAAAIGEDVASRLSRLELDAKAE